MANLLVEGFDWFPSGQSAAVRDRLWGANNFFALTGVSHTTADVATGRFGFGKAMRVVNGGAFDTFGYIAALPSVSATGFIGFSMFVQPTTSNGCGPVIGFYDGVNDAPQITAHFTSNGVIKVYRGAAGTGTYLGASKVGSYQQNEWFNCEAKATIDAGGSIEIRINTVPVVQISANTKSTSVAGFDSIMISGFRTGTTVSFDYLIDDLFANDTTGSTCNDWAGNLRVKTQFMIANGAVDDFTIGGTSPAPTQWQSVLNQLIDDSSFVYSSTVGQQDLFTPDPNLNAPYVRVVQVRGALRQDDATQRSAKMLLRIGSSVYANAVEHFTNQTFTFYKGRWELSPATGVSFTGSEVNGLQAGLTVQS